MRKLLVFLLIFSVNVLKAKGLLEAELATFPTETLDPSILLCDPPVRCLRNELVDRTGCNCMCSVSMYCEDPYYYNDVPRTICGCRCMERCKVGYTIDPFSCACVQNCEQPPSCDKSKGLIWYGAPDCVCKCDPSLVPCPYGGVRDPDTCECQECNSINAENCKKSYYEGFNWYPYPDCRCACENHGDTLPCPDGQYRNKTCQCQCNEVCPPELNQDPVTCKCVKGCVRPITCDKMKGMNWLGEPDCRCECLYPDSSPCPDGQFRNKSTCECQCKEICHEGYINDPVTCKCIPGCNQPASCDSSKGLLWFGYPDCVCKCDPSLVPCPYGGVRDPDTCECQECNPIDAENCKKSYYEGFNWYPYPDCRCACENHGDTLPCPDGQYRNKTCQCQCNEVCPPELNQDPVTCECVKGCVRPITCDKMKGMNWLGEPDCRCECLYPDSSPCPDGQFRNESTCECQCKEICHDGYINDPVTCRCIPGCNQPESCDSSKGLLWFGYPDCVCKCYPDRATIACPNGGKRDPTTCECLDTTPVYCTNNTAYDICKRAFYEGFLWVDYPVCRCDCTLHSQTTPCPQGYARNPKTCKCECIPKTCTYPFVFNPDRCDCSSCNSTAINCINYQTFNQTSCSCVCDLNWLVIKPGCENGTYFDFKICGCNCDRPASCDATKGWIWYKAPDCVCKCDPTLVPCPNGGVRDAKCECPICNPIDAENCKKLFYEGFTWYPYPACRCNCTLHSQTAPCPASFTRNPTTCKCECIPKTCTFPFAFNPERCDCSSCDPNANLCVNYQTFNKTSCRCVCDPAIPKPECINGGYFDYERCICRCDRPASCDASKGWVWTGYSDCACKCDPTLVPCPNGLQRDAKTCECPDPCPPKWCPPGYTWFGYPICNCLCSPQDCPRPTVWSQKDCRCVCNNGASEVNCFSPGVWKPEECYCDCPYWAYLKCCKETQFLNWNTCECNCKENCRDCSKPQMWSKKFCDCRCPNQVRCSKNRFWNDWSCTCECKQKPRRCCHPYGNMFWDKTACNCVCKKIQSCRFPYYVWDDYKCACVARSRNLISYDYLLEVPLELEINEAADFEAVEDSPAFEDIAAM